MGRLTLVLGGQKSGKSSLAARRAAASGRPVVVVTPAVARDPEFAARIARHRADRPDHWQTLETFDLIQALDDAGTGAFVLIDALDTWLAETLERTGLTVDDTMPDPTERDRVERSIVEEMRTFAATVAVSDHEVLVIAGQPGLGVHAGGPGARAYVDFHGIAVQGLSAAADEVLLVVAGRTLPLTPDESSGQPRPRLARSSLAGYARPHPDWPELSSGVSELRQHGDTQVPQGAIDLAVNVEPGPPQWLADRLTESMGSLATYPDDRPARDSIAARHHREPADCLPTDGAAEAFWLLASTLRPRLAACVQPSFTEPEAALRAAGVPVRRIFRESGDDWMLDPRRVPEAADLVVIGRPDNPTGALDPISTIERLARPGRALIVDEAFADFLDNAEGVAGRSDIPGLVVVRSLTKLWGLAGLRVGYLVGPSALVRRLDQASQPWSCNNLALTALEALIDADDERRERAAAVAARRDDLVTQLTAIEPLRVWASPANFVLIQSAVPHLRDRLLEYGLAVRRAETFPGLDDTSVRVAVRDETINRQLADALLTIVKGPS